MKQKFVSLSVLLVALAGVSCNDTDEKGGSSAPPVRDAYMLTVPASYDSDAPVPLVLLLYGYSASAAGVRDMFDMDSGARRHGFIAVYPRGVYDSAGNRYWNANDTCCQDGDSTPDDVAYLESVIDEIAGEYNVDSDRIYIVGHSNGGSMAYRMACDRSSRIAAVVSLAGPTWNDPSQCSPDESVPVLRIHGSVDGTVFYDGGVLPNNKPYPSAIESVNEWSNRNGCTGALMDIAPNLDFDSNVQGEETRIQAAGDCPPDIEVQLWTVLQGDHFPDISAGGLDAVWAFLSAHSNT